MPIFYCQFVETNSQTKCQNQNPIQNKIIHILVFILLPIFSRGGQQNILKPTSKFHRPSPSGGRAAPSGRIDRQIDRQISVSTLSKYFLIRGGNRIFSNQNPKYLYPICHKYFLKPKTKTQYKTFFIMVSTLSIYFLIRGWAIEYL